MIPNTGIIALVRLKGVSPVRVLVVVLYAHKTLGSSSDHMSFSLVQPILEDLKQGLVRHFCLAVSLGVTKG